MSTLGQGHPEQPGEPAPRAPRVLLNVARPWGETSPVTLARAGAAAGLDGVGLADSPGLFPDPLLATDRVLADTGLALAGPCVLSLGLREASTVAGALRTLSEQHAERLICFLGRGESSVRNAGLPVPSLRQHLESLERLADLVARAGLGTPLIGAASGPRTISRTSAVLPGVLLDVGTDAGTVTRAAAAARQANPDVRIWLFLRAVIADTEKDRADAAAPVLGSCASRLAAASDFHGLSESERRLAQQVAEAHDYGRHGTSGALATGAASSEAQAFVGRRFIVAGSPSQVQSAVAALAPVDLDGVVLAGALGGVLNHLPQLTTAVRMGLHPARGVA